MQSKVYIYPNVTLFMFGPCIGSSPQRDIFALPTQAAFHMGPSWAHVGPSWAPVGPKCITDPNRTMVHPTLNIANQCERVDYTSIGYARVGFALGTEISCCLSCFVCVEYPIQTLFLVEYRLNDFHAGHHYFLFLQV